MDVVQPLPGLLILPIAWIAAVAGRRINRAVCPALEDETICVAERFVFGLGSGFVILALGILGLGLAGQLAAIPVALLCAVLAGVGGSEHVVAAREIARSFRRLCLPAWLGWVCAIVAIAALGGCFAPPTTVEWDSLSYHLADPKLYVAARRIGYIPWESHSNFAFDMEMLYCIGMLAHSIAFAKLFHFVLGCAGAVATYRLAVRVDPRSAPLALVVYLTLPLVFWEAGTAYVDLGATSYAVLGLLAIAIMARTGEKRFSLIAGVMLGGMFGIKATGAVTVMCYAAGIAIYSRLRRVPIREAVVSAAVVCATAGLLGAAWYVKSAVYTGNPFYPFAYSIFGGRYWNAVNAAGYAAAQAAFGVGHGLSDLALSPYNLSMYLLPGHVAPARFAHPFNDFQFPMASLSPLFLIGALAALMAPLNPPRAVRLMTGYALVSVAIWFAMTQQVRYLLPVAPVLAILSAWAMSRIAERSTPGRVAAALAVTVGIGFNVFLCTQWSVRQWSVALRPSNQAAYLNASLDSFSAIQFLNSSTDPSSKIVCYGEPLTYYLNRDHMWGDLGSEPQYPPYATLGSAASLRQWLLARGYNYILVNTVNMPLAASSGWSGMVYDLTAGSGKQPIFQSRTTVVYAL
jgi:hypothetical protein